MNSRKFLIVGPHSIQGRQTGETVELELTSDQVAALVQGGHIVEVHDEPAPEATAADDVSAAELDGPSDEPRRKKGL